MARGGDDLITRVTPHNIVATILHKGLVGAAGVLIDKGCAVRV
jgi:hypothetical protein